MHHLFDQRYTESEHHLIQRKAKCMIGNYGYRASDADDIRQDLSTHVFLRTHLYRPGPAPRSAWVGKIADNKLRNMIEKRTAQKRDNRRDVGMEDFGPDRLLDNKHTTERTDLRLDLQEVMRRMPPKLRSVANFLGDHKLSQIGEELHLTRGQVRHRLAQIERILREAGYS